MIYTITLILIALIAINFLLLAFSTNKIKKVAKPKKAKINKPLVVKRFPKTVTSSQIPGQLSPTGS